MATALCAVDKLECTLAWVVVVVQLLLSAHLRTHGWKPAELCLALSWVLQIASRVFPLGVVLVMGLLHVCLPVLCVHVLLNRKRLLRRW